MVVAGVGLQLCDELAQLHDGLRGGGARSRRGRRCVEWREADAQYLGQDLEILLQHELVRACARHAEDGKERSLWSSDSSAKAGLGKGS